MAADKAVDADEGRDADEWADRLPPERAEIASARVAGTRPPMSPVSLVISSPARSAER